MRRLIFLLCAVVLLLDLADDGCLGKVKLVSSHNAAKCSVTSCDHNSGKIDPQFVLPPAKLREYGREFIDRQVSGGIGHNIELDDFCYFGSSGGIPL
jgi:hypothetical protein